MLVCNTSQRYGWVDLLLNLQFSYQHKKLNGNSRNTNTNKAWRDVQFQFCNTVPCCNAIHNNIGPLYVTCLRNFDNWGIQEQKDAETYNYGLCTCVSYLVWPNVEMEQFCVVWGSRSECFISILESLCLFILRRVQHYGWHRCWTCQTVKLSHQKLEALRL